MSLWLRTSAWVELGARYCETVAHHWRHRERGGPRYSAAEAEFLPAALALIEKPVSPTARVTASVLIALLGFALLWAVLGHIDIVVVAPGKVIPSGRVKSIAAVEVARVQAIHVVEGQRVRAGDILVELDAGMIEAERRRAEADVEAARLEMARSRALIDAIDSLRAPMLPSIEGVRKEAYEYARNHLAGQYLDFQARLAQLDGEIRRYSAALPLAQERARSFEVLAKTKDIPRSSYSEKLQEVIDLEGQLTQATNARLSLIAQTRRQALDSLTAARDVVIGAAEDAARASSHAHQFTLRAPVDGTVQQLAVHTIGGVVPAAQSLMLIVPTEDEVEVDAYLENKDVGYVREGQLAQLKVDAFDYTRHGLVAGKVVAVSKDAIEDERRGVIYRTRVRLDEPYVLVEGERRHLSPGMTVSTEIKTGQRRIIEFVLSPLMRRSHDSLRER